MKPIENPLDFKKELINTLKSQIKNRLDELNQNLEDLKNSRDSDTKSSMGDKYETGREMIQLEINNVQRQIAINQGNRDILARMNIARKERAGHGSLLLTAQGSYFLGAGVGEITIGDKKVYCISTKSPIGQLLTGKKKGETIVFRQAPFIIEGIY